MKLLTRSFTDKKYSLQFLILSVFAVFFCVFTPILVQDAVAIIGILTFGILHGANDLKIISQKTSHSAQSDRMKSFGLYVGVVFLGILLFFYLPRFALLIFVAVSCYHFGEQHWSERTQTTFLKPWIFSTYGILIFSMLFALQYHPSSEVITQITSVVVPHYFFWVGLILSLIGLVLLLVIEKVKKQTLLIELFLLIILGLLFWNASLLFAFGFYFVIWHSIPSLSSQLNYIYGDTKKSNLILYIKSAWLYWLGALSGLFLFFYYVEVEEAELLSLFFSFLAAITFPHAIVMGLMFHSNPTDGD